jgi:hypothetical protein
MKYYNANISILDFNDRQHMVEDNPVAPFYYDSENKIKRNYSAKLFYVH